MEIIYLDDALLVLNKPAGLPVLPEGWEPDAPYLVKMLEQEYGRVWIVHRLDKVTSGVMVFARTAETHRDLSIQFEKHQARKIYHAILSGVPGWNEKTTRHPLRVNVGHKHRTMVDNKNGKPSETSFKIIERHGSYTLVEAQLMTGRTHQIRAHAYALGFPLLGDVLYSAPETDLIARPALHAYSLSLRLQGTAEESPNAEHRSQMTFTAPYPLDFEHALEQIRASS
jgi:RluA family pseudouridine synthase